MSNRLMLLLGVFLVGVFFVNLREMNRDSVLWLGPLTVITLVLAVGLILNSYGVMPV